MSRKTKKPTWFGGVVLIMCVTSSKSHDSKNFGRFVERSREVIVKEGVF